MPRLTVFFLRAALLQFGIGITFGGLMLANKGVPFMPALWGLLHPHVELLISGWTLQLALGVAHWILPRLPGPQRYGRMRLGWLAFGLLNAGVTLAALAQWPGIQADTLSLAGRGAQVVAIILFVYHIWPRIRALGTGAALETI